MDHAPLAAALGHAFADRSLLGVALTHRSFGVPNNERLEFLGDGVLNCVVATLLFERFPALPEGELSRLRATLVRQEALHGLALQLGLGAHLALGEGEVASGGRERPSILADALEAVFGAIYRDAGFAAAEAAISRLYRPLLDALRPGNQNKDAKTRLQEWLQGRRRPLPQYRLVEASGAAHQRQFNVSCEIAEPAMTTTGQGGSRRLAEQAAAEAALQMLQR